ncbi:MAG: META domain-containing protein [Sphingomonadales bacterium]|nr:META domain-containing protein [Sphingomonadales bacterium]
MARYGLGLALCAGLAALVAVAQTQAMGPDRPTANGEGIEMTGESAAERLAGTWTVTEVANGTIPEGITPALVFEADQLAGFAGCNNFGAPATYGADGAVKFGGARLTRKACDQTIMSFEVAMIRAIERTNSVDFDSADQITLTGFGKVMLRATRGLKG